MGTFTITCRNRTFTSLEITSLSFVHPGALWGLSLAPFPFSAGTAQGEGQAGRTACQAYAFHAGQRISAKNHAKPKPHLCPVDGGAAIVMRAGG